MEDGQASFKDTAIAGNRREKRQRRMRRRIECVQQWPRCLAWSALIPMSSCFYMNATTVSATTFDSKQKLRCCHIIWVWLKPAYGRFLSSTAFLYVCLQALNLCCCCCSHNHALELNAVLSFTTRTDGWLRLRVSAITNTRNTPCFTQICVYILHLFSNKCVCLSSTSQFATAQRLSNGNIRHSV